MLGPRRYETNMGNGSQLCLQVERGPRPGVHPVLERSELKGLWFPLDAVLPVGPMQP